MIKSIKKVNTFVLDFYKTKNSEKITYHTYQHTLELVKSANKLIKKSDFNTSETVVLQMALLFSNLGYNLDYKNPFEKNIEILEEYFVNESEHKELKEDISGCLQVLLTKTPATDLEKAFLDIYFSDFGRKKFLKRNSLLRYEINAFSNEKLSEYEWIAYQIGLLTNHKYYSDYAIMNWQPTKRKNLASLLKAKSKLEKVDEKERLKAKYKTKYKNESPERGIQTLYRVALRNHIKLSDIADTKANILLSVNAIIISLVLANIIPQLDNPSNRFMILPTIIFVTFSIISMIMSIKATQPNVTRGEFTQEDLKNKNVNLAFFGNFHKMELEKYQSAFSNLIKKKEDVYDTLTKDLYFLGSVLDSKYKLLRYTYLVFMSGIIISVLVFAIAFIYRDSITI